LNIPLESLSRGSGPNGRLILSDLEALTSDGERYSADAPSVPESAATPSVLHRMSKMRRTIADRLQQSKQTIPHFYLRVSVRVDRLWALRATLTDVQATLNDWILLACGRALAESPILRSRLRGDEIVESSDCNIGVAVAVADGVLVPVVKNVDKLRLAQLAAETKRIIGDTRKGVIANAGQGVFTITNLGMHGIDEFSAIINPPEAAILAVGAAREQVVAENGSIRVGRTLVLTLSADHRLVDGAAAAGFLTKLRLLLELEDEVWWR
jgi:pyruvate dehydrogenase E2 component (dihydrolipoamide acetyltransferase)